MSVELGIRHRDSDEYEVVPIATAETFRRVWLPACERLGLELVPLFSGGSLTVVPQELVPRIVAEVVRLQQWAAAQPDGDYLSVQCASILAAFGRTDPAACEYDFG